MAALPPVLQARRAQICLGLVIALVVLRALLPVALARAIAWGAERTTGLPVEVGDVDLALLRGGVALERVAIAGVGAGPGEDGRIDPATALVRFERLAANLQWLSLLGGRIHLAELTLSGPTVAIELDERGNPRLPEGSPEAEAEPPPPVVKEPPQEAAAEEKRDEGGSDWPIALDRLEVNGFDLRMDNPTLEGAEPALHLGLGALEMADLRWAGGELGLGGIGLREPLLRIRRDFLLAERPPAQEAGEAKPEPAAAARAHRVERIGIERMEFTLLTDAGLLELALTLEATGITTVHGEVFPFRIGLEIGGGSLTISGEAGMDPASFAGLVVWQDLPVRTLALAADPELAGWLRSASSAGQIEIGFGPATDGALVLSGEASLDGFDFGQPGGDEVALRWKSLAVQLARSVVPTGDGAGPPNVDIAAVTWVEPQARYTIPAPALDALLGGSEAETAEPESEAAADAAPPAQVRIRQLTVTGGDVHFVDRTAEPTFEGHLARLSVSASELRLPDNRAKTLRLSGRAPGGAEFSLEGVPEEGGRLVFELERLGLAQFDAYSASAAGYHVDGEATLKTEIELRKDRVDAGSKLVLHGIGLQSAGKATLDELIGMPIDLALALLRDTQGDIRLGIPVSVDRGGVSVSLGAVLRDAVRAAIAGAVLAPLKLANTASSPFKALGSALATGRSDRLSIPPLEAVPGEARLAEGQSERLETMIEFLTARPELLLVLHGRSDEIDRDGLARRILIERVQADEDLPEIEGVGFFARRGIRGALSAMGRGQTPGLDEEESALLARYLEAVYVPPPRYDALARERAEWLRAELVERHGVDASRLRLAEDVETGSPSVRMALGVLESP